MHNTCMAPQPRPVVDRILARSERLPSGCLIFTGARTKYGYGIVQLGRGVGTARVHRVIYEHAHGPLPPHLTVDHLCGVTNCVEVTHLEAVTRAENVNRQWASGRADPGRSQREKTHCVNGHPFDADNTRISPSTGQRCCRACDREKSRRHRARKAKPA